jgi:Resolvase, N terminal domain
MNQCFNIIYLAGVFTHALNDVLHGAKRERLGVPFFSLRRAIISRLGGLARTSASSTWTLRQYHDVSFVSVTQEFNTTTSMGRLTLNVLPSFAQFEWEITSERSRDKIAASKRTGLWVGGPLPLGYELKDGKPATLNEAAEQVRMIFRRYLEVSGIKELVRDLRAKKYSAKCRRKTSRASWKNLENSIALTRLASWSEGGEQTILARARRLQNSSLVNHLCRICRW